MLLLAARIDFYVHLPKWDPSTLCGREIFARGGEEKVVEEHVPRPM